MRFEGESTITTYEREGRVALFSSDIPDGAITGGSGNDPEDGTAGSITRIRWWIYYNSSTDSYEGGTTGDGWYRSTDNEPYRFSNGPFEGEEDSVIYSHAEHDTNLDYYFNAWNSAASPSLIHDFQGAILEYSPLCISIGGMGS